jgi:hypothetical protein
VTRCFLCERRRGVRHCPALNSEICSPCCGSKRRREVNCPDDCPRLTQSRDYLAHRLEGAEVLDAARKMSPDLLHNLELAILTTRDTRFRDLRDQEVKEALENTHRTILTVRRGVLYAYKSSDPRVQILTDAVQALIAKHSQGEEGLRKPAPEEFEGCLVASLAVLKAAVRRNPESTEYLDLVTQYSQGHLLRPPTHEPRKVGRLYLPGQD